MQKTRRQVFTERDVESIAILLKDIRKYKVLTREQEYALWEKMRNGDKEALDLLICSNLRYVLSEAKQYLWSGVALEDLFQAGAIGLTLAANMYDASTGNTLLSFAVWHIRSEIQKAVNTHKRHTATDYLEEPIFNNDGSSTCLLDKLCLEHKFNADWDARYATAFEEKKALVTAKFSKEAARFWADYLQMREKGYSLRDVAKKYKVSEGHAKNMLEQIMQSLREYETHYGSAA